MQASALEAHLYFGLLRALAGFVRDSADIERILLRGIAPSGRPLATLLYLSVRAGASAPLQERIRGEESDPKDPELREGFAQLLIRVGSRLQGLVPSDDLGCTLDGAARQILERVLNELRPGLKTDDALVAAGLPCSEDALVAALEEAIALDRIEIAWRASENVPVVGDGAIEIRVGSRMVELDGHARSCLVINDKLVTYNDGKIRRRPVPIERAFAAALLECARGRPGKISASELGKLNSVLKNMDTGARAFLDDSRAIAFRSQPAGRPVRLVLDAAQSPVAASEVDIR